MDYSASLVKRFGFLSIYGGVTLFSIFFGCFPNGFPYTKFDYILQSLCGLKTSHSDLASQINTEGFSEPPFKVQANAINADEEPQAVIFLHGIWRHIKEFGIEGQIPRIPSPVKPELKKPRDPKQHVNQNIT